MKIRSTIRILVLSVILAGVAGADPFNIIIVTSDVESERGYTEFLQDIYRGNVQVRIEPDRYDEQLSNKKMLELESADLIIISRDNDSGDYNKDSDFWNSLDVPVLNHNIKLARSDGHSFWDWLDGDDTIVSPCTYLDIADPNDEIFTGIDTSGGTVGLFAVSGQLDYSDQASAGYGTVVAASDSNVVIARWLGGEPNYYDGSYYAPNAPRVFFAMPKMTCEFFDGAGDDGRLMLENAILSLLPVIRPAGDLDDDGDVDLDDFSLFATYWLASGCTGVSPCSTAELTGDGNVTFDDLIVFTDSWLVGADTTAPEPNIMSWEIGPMTTSASSIYMRATTAYDTQNGIEYYFQCTSDNGPDSGWQYGDIYEPNGLAQGTQYIYTVAARDTSGNFNQTEFSEPVAARTFEIYREIADASAGVAVDANVFVVADDEGNRLCLYDSNNPDSAPIAEANVGQFLRVDPCQPETDIEGATWFNGRIFWMTSHGRNKDGKYWYSRYQFFATTVTGAGENIHVSVDGNYTNLIDDLIAYDSVYNLGLAAAIGVVDGHIDTEDIPDLAPKEKGLNIEGLCTTADGSSMLIGFRNLRPKLDDTKLGLIIPLNNPEAVVLTGAPADFGPPVLLDFDGFGIRSIEYSHTLGQYLIIAGSHKSGSDKPLQVLYKYDMTNDALTEVEDFPIITPEAMFQFPGSGDVQLLSDDGILMVDTPEGPVPNKLLPRELRTFRAHQITP